MKRILSAAAALLSAAWARAALAVSRPVPGAAPQEPVSRAWPGWLPWLAGLAVLVLLVVLVRRRPGGKS